MPSIATDRPLTKAVEAITRKVPVGSAMTSAEWEMLNAEIRDRAFFSARVEEERILNEMKERIQARIELAKREGRTMDRGVFMEEMRELLRDGGYKRPDGVKRGSLRDLRSHRRLGLIWDMNVAQAQGYAKWVADMTEEGLENEPAYELIRVMNRVEVRDWPTIWRQAGGEFYDGDGSNDDYPLAPGRMIALKTDPIWRRISRFGVPWPPFDWGSGMGLRGIGRDETDAFGITSQDWAPVPDESPFASERDERVTPLAVPFNQGHRMSIKGLPESARESLRSDFGDTIRFDGDEVVMQRELTPETYEQRKAAITESLRERARNHFIQARDQFARELRREGAGTEVGDGSEGAEDIHAIYLAQAASVAVGRKRLFHDTMPPADTEAFFHALSKTMPPEVAVDVAEGTGDILVWRRDLLDLDPKRVVAEMHDGRGGLLMGYGLDSPAWVSPGPHVAVRIYRLPRMKGDKPIMGFDAPVDGWRVFANARATDISSAWGAEVEFEWEEMP